MPTAQHRPLRKHLRAREVKPGSIVYLRGPDGRFTDHEWTFVRHSAHGYLQVVKDGEYRTADHNHFVQVKVAD